MPKTTVERILEWLDEQPQLISKGMLKKRIKKMKSIEKAIIKRCYVLGWENYAHPTNYKMKAETFYQRRYGPKASKKPLKRERDKLKGINSIKPKKDESE
jgi:hypothetical protein